MSSSSSELLLSLLSLIQFNGLFWRKLFKISELIRWIAISKLWRPKLADKEDIIYSEISNLIETFYGIPFVYKMGLSSQEASLLFSWAWLGPACSHIWFRTGLSLSTLSSHLVTFHDSQSRSPCYNLTRRNITNNQLVKNVTWNNLILTECQESLIHILRRGRAYPGGLVAEEYGRARRRTGLPPPLTRTRRLEDISNWSGNLKWQKEL